MGKRNIYYCVLFSLVSLVEGINNLEQLSNNITLTSTEPADPKNAIIGSGTGSVELPKQSTNRVTTMNTYITFQWLNFSGKEASNLLFINNGKSGSVRNFAEDSSEEKESEEVSAEKLTSNANVNRQTIGNLLLSLYTIMLYYS